MKTKLLTAFVASGLMLISGLSFPAKSNAEVSVNINIPLPGLVVGAPPAMVVIPGTCAYYPPDVDANIFFYRGYWYRPYGGHWFISAEYNGPWGSIAINSVPRVLINLPPSYRRIPPYYKRMPYGMVRKHWRTWEEERHWDRYEDENPRGGHGMGRGMGMGMR